MNKTRIAIGFVLAMALLSFGVALAQDSAPTPRPVSDDQVNAIAKQMYCPVCENTPLDVCPTQACAEWRELIRDKLVDGWSETQIKTYFVDRFGDRVLAAPPPRGINWLVYIIPPLIFLAGVYLLFRVFLGWRSLPAQVVKPAEEPSEPIKDPYFKRLEEELRKG